MVYKSRISAGNLCCTVSQERFLARKMRIRTMSIVPTLFLGVEYCATFQAALYIETHSLMHQSEFHAASVAQSRAADKRKSLINYSYKKKRVYHHLNSRRMPEVYWTLEKSNPQGHRS